MTIGVIALARPTFDVEYAEEVAEAAFAVLDDVAPGFVGGRDLCFDADSTRRAISELEQAELEALIILQVTFTDATMTSELAAAIDAPLIFWAFPEDRTGGRLRLNGLCGINLAAHALGAGSGTSPTSTCGPKTGEPPESWPACWPAAATSIRRPESSRGRRTVDGLAAGGRAGGGVARRSAYRSHRRLPGWFRPVPVRRGGGPPPDRGHRRPDRAGRFVRRRRFGPARHRCAGAGSGDGGAWITRRSRSDRSRAKPPPVRRHARPGRRSRVGGSGDPLLAGVFHRVRRRRLCPPGHADR